MAQEGNGGTERFFQQHHRELGRLAYLLTGESGAADDLLGDVFLAVWRQWRRVCERDEPLAYVRRMVLNMAASRVRRLARERRRDGQVRVVTPREAPAGDGASVFDVRAALLQLPSRRRACVALRYALDLGEQEVAELLGISVGTVKSQTAKGVAQLRDLLGDEPPHRAPSGGHHRVPQQLDPSDGTTAELRSLGLRRPA